MKRRDLILRSTFGKTISRTPSDRSQKLDPESERRRVNALVELVAWMNPRLVVPPRPASTSRKKASPKQKKASSLKKGSGRAHYPRSPSQAATRYVQDPFGAAGPSYAPSGFGGQGAYAPDVFCHSVRSTLFRVGIFVADSLSRSGCDAFDASRNASHVAAHRNVNG